MEAGTLRTHVGVFVAGMDAGRAYNDFPYMAGQWIPDEYWAIRGWRGFFENTAAVQLHHRVLAGTTLVSVFTTWALFRGRLLPRASHHLLNGLAAMTAVQVSPQNKLRPTKAWRVWDLGSSIAGLFLMLTIKQAVGYVWKSALHCIHDLPWYMTSVVVSDRQLTMHLC